MSAELFILATQRPWMIFEIRNIVRRTWLRNMDSKVNIVGAESFLLSGTWLLSGRLKIESTTAYDKMKRMFKHNTQQRSFVDCDQCSSISVSHIQVLCWLEMPSCRFHYWGGKLYCYHWDKKYMFVLIPSLRLPWYVVMASILPFIYHTTYSSNKYKPPCSSYRCLSQVL